MVRHKTRWLLIQVDVGETTGQQGGTTQSSSSFTRRELVSAIRENLQVTMGLNSAAAEFDTRGTCSSKDDVSFRQSSHCLDQSANPSLSPLTRDDPSVRFWDEERTHLLLLRTPREFLPLVRASLAFLTTIGSKRQVSFSTLSVHGSARTAKLATIGALRRSYRAQILQHHRATKNATRGGAGSKDRSVETRLCTQMEESLLNLQSIDF